MNDQGYVYAIALVIALLFVWQVLSKRFDPFAPSWLFLVGYSHVYFIQPISLREWALTIRGIDVITAANFRALWALVWFLAVYYRGPWKWLAGRLPKPPEAWSVGTVSLLSPVLCLWGFYCAWSVIAMEGVVEFSSQTAEETLFRSFPFVMMVSGILLIVTGRQASGPRPAMLVTGLCITGAYVALWMFNGKRSHSLIGVLATVCALYITRQKRPSWPVLLGTAFTGAMVVALAIGWRGNMNYDRSISGFLQYLGDFKVTAILESLNIEDDADLDTASRPKSYETLEYGGYLLMMDTVPEKADYDYGANYIRTVSTFIPRIIWTNKPLYGRDKWVKAWQAGSELKRDDDFAGPAIGLMGATQLNGGDIGTLIVMAVLAGILRTAYEYFLKHDSCPWVQAWWALTYFNAWFMVVADDPMNWFYYNWGFTCMPTLALLWVANKVFGSPVLGRSVATV